MIAVAETPNPRNDHLSFSRLSRWEQCPLSYFLHYVDKHEGDPGMPVRFGKVIHSVLEHLLQEVIDEELTGPLSQQCAVELYREAWTQERLSGFAFFDEGLRILESFISDQGEVDNRDILAVEKPFELRVGPFTVVGYIDRVDQVDAETIRVIDYKSNRLLFTRDEVDTSLQMSLYELAARRLWPWVKKVQLSFWMLRHRVQQETTRTPEQLQAAAAYVHTLGAQTETATEFPARLNPNCIYCDHRKQCPTYAKALEGKRDFICENLEDLEAVAREREQVARLGKVLDARKKELEAVLKAHLKNTDELLLAGTRYTMFNVTSVDYPLEPTLALVRAATGLERDILLARLATVDKDALGELLKEFGKTRGKARASLLKAELEAKANKRHTPRLWAKEIKG